MEVFRQYRERGERRVFARVEVRLAARVDAVEGVGEALGVGELDLVEDLLAQRVVGHLGHRVSVRLSAATRSRW